MNETSAILRTLRVRPLHTYMSVLQLPYLLKKQSYRSPWGISILIGYVTFTVLHSYWLIFFILKLKAVLQHKILSYNPPALEAIFE